MIRSVIKGAASVCSGVVGEVAGNLIDDCIGGYCWKKCDESDSIIAKGIFGTVGLLASTVGCVGHVIQAGSDAIGDMVADSSGV